MDKVGFSLPTVWTDDWVKAGSGDSCLPITQQKNPERSDMFFLVSRKVTAEQVYFGFSSEIQGFLGRTHVGGA